MLPRPSRRHWLRWVLGAIAVLVAGTLLAAVVYVHLLLRPDRFTTLLQRNLAVARLDLTLAAPAEPALFPRPAVQLKGLSLYNHGASMPLLQADGATIVVPWRALWRGEVAIQRIDIQAPRVDLDQLRALFAQLPRRAGPPRLPTVDAGIHIVHGTLLRNQQPWLFNFTLTTGTLAPGRPFQLDASAHDATGGAITLGLRTTPAAPADGAIKLAPLWLDLALQDTARLNLTGEAAWRGGDALSAHLAGTLQHTPTAVSASTPGATPRLPAAADHVTLDLLPASAAQPATVALKLDGNHQRIDLRVQPTEFGAWWRRILAATPNRPPGPLPITGTARIPQLDLGWLHARDLTIDAGPDLQPASSASSAAPPAASASASAQP